MQASGEALQSWHSTGHVPAFSSRNFSKVRRAKLLGSHVASSVFLTASVAVDAAGDEGQRVVAPAQAHHFFTKMKMAGLRDPAITLAFGSSDAGLSVTVSCTAPAPSVPRLPITGALFLSFKNNIYEKK